MDIIELKEMLNGRIESVCRYLLPNGRRQSHEWRVGDVNGAAGNSLGIHLSGDKAGIWCDFESGEERGDVIDLWQAVRGVSLSESLQEIRQFLNVPEDVKPVKKKKYDMPKAPKIQNLGVKEIDWLTNTRKLSKATIDKYGVKAEKGMLYFPTIIDGELVHWKEMPINKEMRSKLTRTSTNTPQSLFGWHTIPDGLRELIITEGELDAMSMMEYGYHAVSVPFGAKNFNWIELDWEKLAQFEKIYLSFDMDEPGRKATLDAVDRLGIHRCAIVDLPYKDINDCLQNGVTKSVIDEAIRKAKQIDHVDLKDASYFKDGVIEEFYPLEDSHSGFKLKFHPKFENLHFLYGDMTIWSGFNGHGKTTLIQQMVLDALSQGERFCMASLEMRPQKYLKTMVKQATGLSLPQKKDIETVIDWFSSNLIIYNKQGKINRNSMIEAFEYARKRFGVKNFIIDSLLKCGIAETDWDTQKLFTEELADFAQEKNVHIHLVAHSRKLDKESQKPDKLDIKGTGSITDVASNVLIHWRNKDKERATDEGKFSDAPDAILYVDKQRHNGWEGMVPFMFDRDCCQFYSSLTGKINYFTTEYDEPPF